MSFFKNMFGGEQSDPTPKKRVWPQWHVDENGQLSPEELLRQKFIYSRVFKLENKDEKRRFNNKDYVYSAATPSHTYNGEEWRVYNFSYNDGDVVPKDDISTWQEEAVYVLQKLLNFEKDMLRRGAKPIDGTTSNLAQFAATLGYCITNDNNLVQIDGNKPVTASLSMPRDVAQKFFVAAGTKAPTSTWEWLYERYVDSMAIRFGDAVQALQENTNYKYVIDKTVDRLKNFNALPVTVTKDINYTSKRDAVLKMIRDTDFRTAEYITDPKARALYDYATAMTCVVTLLRAGSIVLHNEPDMDAKGTINFQKVALLRYMREAVHKILEERLGMLEGERDAICDVMLRDKDPRAGITPLEILYTAFPAMPKVDDPAVALKRTGGSKDIM